MPARKSAKIAIVIHDQAGLQPPRFESIYEDIELSDLLLNAVVTQARAHEGCAGLVAEIEANIAPRFLERIIRRQRAQLKPLFRSPFGTNAHTLPCLVSLLRLKEIVAGLGGKQ